MILRIIFIHVRGHILNKELILGRCWIVRLETLLGFWKLSHRQEPLQGSLPY